MSLLIDLALNKCSLKINEEENSTSYIRRGVLLQCLGHHNLAILDFTKASETSNAAMIYFLRACSFYDIGKSSLAYKDSLEGMKIENMKIKRKNNNSKKNAILISLSKRSVILEAVINQLRQENLFEKLYIEKNLSYN